MKMRAMLCRRSVEGALLAALLVAAGGRVCRAEVAIHALVIGNNQALPGAGDSASGAAMPSLRYADDDAAAFYELIGGMTDDAHLLTVMDRDTQTIYPTLGALARPPTLRELRAAVAALGQSIERDHSEGRGSVLFIFFSGHGSMVEDRTPTLALLDGGISQELLYDEILEKLPADYVHILVDACHAEAVVRPRDIDAQSIRVAPADAKAFLVQSTLARFPHVGAIVAAASDARSHEWDALHQGVFTHELLSALRGAADVNRDHRIEYSEVFAFLGAANHGVRDPRARLSVAARPPDLNRSVALLDLTQFSSSRIARLTGVPGRAGLVRLEEGTGRLLASLRGEPGFDTDLIVSAGQTIYVSAGSREARFDAKAGDNVVFAGLAFADPQQRARGALEDAMRRGLFANEFGRHYYNGFIDHAPDFDPVSFPAEMKDGAAESLVPGEIGIERPASVDGPPPVSSSARLVLGAGASTPVARTFTTTSGLRAGLRPGGRHGAIVSIDLLRAAQHSLAEWQMMASIGWVRVARYRAGRGWLGASVGGGAIVQTVEGRSQQWSGQLAAGPALGLMVDLVGRVGLWGEGQLWGVAYRREGQTVAWFSPSAWIGLCLGL